MAANSWESPWHRAPILPGISFTVVLVEEGATRSQAGPQLASLAQLQPGSTAKTQQTLPMVILVATDALSSCKGEDG